MTCPSRHVLPLTAILCAASALPSLAQWTPGGVPLAPAVTVHWRPRVAPDGTGGAFVAWSDSRRIRALRLSENGAVANGWRADSGLVVAPRSRVLELQQEPLLAPDGAGGVFALWLDTRDHYCEAHCLPTTGRVYLTRLTRDGAAAAGWPVDGMPIGSEGNFFRYFRPCMLPDGGGGVVVVWAEWEAVRAQRVTAEGRLLWGERGLRVSGSSRTLAQALSMAPDRKGGAIVVWEADNRLFGQYLSGGGDRLWPDEGSRMTHETPGTQLEFQSSVVGDGRSGWTVAWTADFGNGIADVMMQRVEALGRLLWPMDVRAASVQRRRLAPTLLAGNAGDVWLAWMDAPAGVPTGDLYIQQFSRFGTVRHGWPADGLRLREVSTHQSAYRIGLAEDARDGAYVAVIDRAGAWAFRVTGRGEKARDWPEEGARLTSPSALGSAWIDLVSDLRHGAVATWEQRPTERPFVGCWPCSYAAAARLIPTGLASDGARRLAQPPPLPGRGGSGQALGLERPQLDPHGGAARVGFRLPDDAPAWLEVLDLAGRRLVRREVGGLGAGSHEVELVPAGRVPAGIYLVRLKRGEEARVVRAFLR